MKGGGGPRNSGVVVGGVRTDGRTKLLPVLILTSSRQDQDLVAIHRLSANSYFKKPVGFEQFVAAVRNLGLYRLVLNEPPPDRV